MKSLEKSLAVATFILAMYSAWFLLPFLGALGADGIAQIIIPRVLIFIFGLAAAFMFWSGHGYSVHLLFSVWFLALLTGVNLFNPPGQSGVFISLEAMVSFVAIVALVYYIVKSRRHDQNT